MAWIQIENGKPQCNVVVYALFEHKSMLSGEINAAFVENKPVVTVGCFLPMEKFQCIDGDFKDMDDYKLTQWRYLSEFNV